MSMKVIASIEERCKTYGLYDCIYEAFFYGTKEECLSRIKSITSKAINYYLLIGYCLESVNKCGKYSVICTLKKGVPDTFTAVDLGTDYKNYKELTIEFHITI